MGHPVPIVSSHACSSQHLCLPSPSPSHYTHTRTHTVHTRDAHAHALLPHIVATHTHIPRIYTACVYYTPFTLHVDRYYHTCLRLVYHHYRPTVALQLRSHTYTRILFTCCRCCPLVCCLTPLLFPCYCSCSHLFVIWAIGLNLLTFPTLLLLHFHVPATLLPLLTHILWDQLLCFCTGVPLTLAHTATLPPAWAFTAAAHCCHWAPHLTVTRMLRTTRTLPLFSLHFHHQAGTHLCFTRLFALHTLTPFFAASTPPVLFALPHGWVPSHAPHLRTASIAASRYAHLRDACDSHGYTRTAPPARSDCHDTTLRYGYAISLERTLHTHTCHIHAFSSPLRSGSFWWCTWNFGTTIPLHHTLAVPDGRMVTVLDSLHVAQFTSQCFCLVFPLRTTVPLLPPFPCMPVTRGRLVWISGTFTTPHYSHTCPRCPPHTPIYQPTPSAPFTVLCFPTAHLHTLPLHTPTTHWFRLPLQIPLDSFTHL